MRFQPTRGISEVAVANDVVPVEDAAGLVAAQFHRHAFRDTGTDHVANCRTAEVGRDTGRASGPDSRTAPRMVEAAPRDAVPGQVQGLACFRGAVVEEDALNNHPFLTLHTIRGLALVREQFLELRCQVEDAT